MPSLKENEQMLLAQAIYNTANNTRQYPAVKQVLEIAYQLFRKKSFYTAALTEHYYRGILNLAFYINIACIYQGKSIDLEMLPKNTQMVMDTLFNELNRAAVVHYSERSVNDAIYMAGRLPLIIQVDLFPMMIHAHYSYLSTVNDSVVAPEIKSSVDKTKPNYIIADPQILPQFIKDNKYSASDNLIFLKKYINLAKNQYIKHSEGIWFSFFHFHGKKGRIRANKFADKFNNINNYDEAVNTLKIFLNNPKKGNTHPHSFRTMLLSTLIGFDRSGFSDVSQHFTQRMRELDSILPAQTVGSRNLGLGR